MDHQRAGAAGNRRGDRRVLELNLRVVDGGAVGLQRGGERLGRRPRLVGLLARRDAARQQVLIAGGARASVGFLRGVAREIGLRLRQRGFERPSIELEQDLALP